jgi:hypothetical protein
MADAIKWCHRLDSSMKTTTSQPLDGIAFPRKCLLIPNFHFHGFFSDDFAALSVTLPKCSDACSDCSVGILLISDVPRNFVRGGGVQQIELRTEDRENGDLGAVAP